MSSTPSTRSLDGKMIYFSLQNQSVIGRYETGEQTYSVDAKSLEEVSKYISQDYTPSLKDRKFFWIQPSKSNSSTSNSSTSSSSSSSSSSSTLKNSKSNNIILMNNNKNTNLITKQNNNNISLMSNNITSGSDSYFSSSNKAIIKAFQALKEQQDLLAEVKVLNSSKAEKKAQELAKISKACRDNLLSTVRKKGVDLKKTLKHSEPPFPIVYRLIEMLRQPEIQCYDGLKREISKTTRIFIELVVVQCLLSKRRIYEKTADQMRTSLSEVVKTLPDEEIISRFEIECTKAAVKKLDKGIGKWKKIGIDFSKDLGVAAVKTLFTASPSGASPAAFADPIINLFIAIHKNREDSWYNQIWSLRWAFLDNKKQRSIKTPKDFQEHLLPLLEGYEKSSHLAFFTADLIWEILQKKDTSTELKNQLITNAKGPSLALLLSLKDSKFRDTRYHVLNYLEKLEPRYDATLINILKIKSRKSEKSYLKNKADLLIKRAQKESSEKFSNCIQENKKLLKKIIPQLEDKTVQYSSITTTSIEQSTGSGTSQPSAAQVQKLQFYEGQLSEAQELLQLIESLEQTTN